MKKQYWNWCQYVRIKNQYFAFHFYQSTSWPQFTSNEKFIHVQTPQYVLSVSSIINLLHKRAKHKMVLHKTSHIEGFKYTRSYGWHYCNRFISKIIKMNIFIFESDSIRFIQNKNVPYALLVWIKLFFFFQFFAETSIYLEVKISRNFISRLEYICKFSLLFH